MCFTDCKRKLGSQSLHLDAKKWNMKQKMDNRWCDITLNAGFKCWVQHFWNEFFLVINMLQKIRNIDTYMFIHMFDDKTNLLEWTSPRKRRNVSFTDNFSSQCLAFKNPKAGEGTAWWGKNPAKGRDEEKTLRDAKKYQSMITLVIPWISTLLKPINLYFFETEGNKLIPVKLRWVSRSGRKKRGKQKNGYQQWS